MTKLEKVALKNKILFIHHGGGIGGAPISMLQLVSSLDKKKYEPTIIFTRPGPVVDLARSKGFNAKVVSLKSAFFYSDHVKIRKRMLFNYFVHYMSTINQTIDLLIKEKPSLVYLNTSVLLPVAKAINNQKIPLIWHIRETPGPNKFIRNWQLNIINELADQIIVTSNYVKSYFENNNNIQTIYNSIDLEQFNINKNIARSIIRNEFKILEESKVICMIGSVQAEKGHYELVKAANQIIKSKPETIFLIIAGGVGTEYAKSIKGKIKLLFNIPFDNFERMKRLISKYNLNKNFVFTGYRTDIPELLAASDLVVFLSQKAEGFGRPLIEGMAAGKPIIATNIGPTSEILGDKTGILFSKENNESMINSIIKLINNPIDSRFMGKEGISRVKKLFNMEKAVFNTEECIDQVIKTYV